MKSKINLILSLALCFSASIAIAGGVKGGGGTGFDDAKTGLDGITSKIQPKLPRYGCREGNRSLFDEVDPLSGRRATVLRTCQNGTYMTPEERAAYIYNPQTRCREGRREVWYERNDHTNSRERRVICLNGKWVTNKKTLSSN